VKTDNAGSAPTSLPHSARQSRLRCVNRRSVRGKTGTTDEDAGGVPNSDLTSAMRKEYTEFLGFKSIFFFCSLPLRLDSYRGCSHGCLYCLSRVLNNRSYAFDDAIIAASPDRLARFMVRALREQSNIGPVSSCIRHRVPAHFGCVSDPLQPAERQHRTTQGFLKVLQQHDYPYVLCTKSTMAADHPYIDIFADTHCSIQVSFSTFDACLAGRLEPKAPPPAQRLRTLERLAAAGIYTVARLQPLLYPAEQLSSGVFETLAGAGVRHVVVEHLRIPTNARASSREALRAAIGLDMLAEYRRLGLRHSRVSHELPSKLKLANVLFARREANRLGMTFGSGDNEFHHLSDHICCCGIPATPAFANIYEGHFGRAAMQGLRSGRVSFGYLDRVWHPEGSIREYVNSDCRIDGPNTVYAFLTDRLGRPGRSNSPLGYFGIVATRSKGYRFVASIRNTLLEGHNHVLGQRLPSG